MHDVNSFTSKVKSPENFQDIWKPSTVKVEALLGKFPVLEGLYPNDKELSVSWDKGSSTLPVAPK